MGLGVGPEPEEGAVTRLLHCPGLVRGDRGQGRAGEGFRGVWGENRMNLGADWM